MGANSFLFEMSPIYMGGYNENDSVGSPESVHIQLNIKIYEFCGLSYHSLMTLEWETRRLTRDQVHQIGPRYRYMK